MHCFSEYKAGLCPGAIVPRHYGTCTHMDIGNVRVESTVELLHVSPIASLSGQKEGELI